MKIILITLANFIRFPILSIKVYFWSKTNTKVSWKRISYLIFLSSLVSKKSFIREGISRLSILIFEVDRRIDTLDRHNPHFEMNVTQILKSDLINKTSKTLITKSKEFELESLIEELISNDLKALVANNFQSYLQHSKFSIGFKVLSIYVYSSLNLSPNNEAIDIFSKLIRILSDLSTFEKDILENRNNVLKFISKKDARDELETYSIFYANYKPENEGDLTIFKIAKYSIKAYSKDKDFEI